MWSSLGRDYNFCGVACRVLLCVRSRCVSNSLSVRSFLFRFGLSSVLVAVVRHQWGESSVSAQSVHFSLLCLCDSRFSRAMLSFSCLVQLWGISCAWILLCFKSSFSIGWSVYPPTCPLNTCCFALQCYCPQGLSLLAQCWVVLVCIVTVMFVAWLEACLLSFASTLGRYLL
jgi:hypothetical protein